MRKFLLLIPTVLFFTACSYQDCHIVNIADSDNITAEEALSYYNTNCADKYTRANIDERLPFILGDAEWLWDKAQASSYEDRSAIDIPLNGGYQYVVYRKQADGTYYSVHTSSKVVAVQDDTTGNISFYIRVSIPDKDEINTSTESLNYEQRASFSGLEYYITIDGCPAAIVKFENGEQTDGVFLGDTTISKVSRLCKFANLFRGLCIGRVGGASRTYVNIGKVTDRFYDAVAGCWYSYIDIDGDGKADAVTGDFDAVVITPEQNLSANKGNGSGDGSGNAGGVTGSDFNSGAGTNVSVNTGLGNGASGFGGGSSTNGSGNENSDGLTDENAYVIQDFLDKNAISVNPIKKGIKLMPIDGIITLPTEPLTPSEVKSLILERLSPTNPLAEFIKSSDIPIYPSSETNRSVKTLIADSKSQAIYYDNYYYNYLLSNAGRLLAIFHEFVHFYINSDNHQLMIDCLEYQQGLRDLFPNMSEIFYEYIQYVGCKGLFVETPKIHDDIKDFSREYIYK